METAETICPPQIEWQASFGGYLSDELFDLLQTPDGGYLLAGYSRSSAGGNITSTNFGNFDYWVVRLDAAGTILWDRNFGGDLSDTLVRAIATRDGGFLLGGSSRSGVSGNKSTPHRGTTSGDFWVVKIDADGNKVWERNLGGTDSEFFADCLETAEGGFLLGGGSRSPADGDKTSQNYGDLDYWIVKLDADGNPEWDLSYGGDDWDSLVSIEEAVGGGYLLAGTSRSDVSGVKSENTIGFSALWFVRIATNGVVVWDKTLGGNSSESGGRAVATADGGFLVGGASWSEVGGLKTAPLIGEADYWVVRLDPAGNVMWDKSFGGGDYDDLKKLALTSDGGFLLGGTSGFSTVGEKTEPGFGQSDYWVVRLDASGNRIWDATYGGLNEDDLRAVWRTSDDGWVVGGSSVSAERDTKTAPNFGSTDFWVIKLAPETPDDCDRDGVSNEFDSCPGTEYGAVVDATGCAVNQICPCDGAFETAAEYVQCVSNVTERFLGEGLISEAEAMALREAAGMADCPRLPEVAVAFGLTNALLGQARFDLSQLNGTVWVQEVGPGGGEGLMVHLGEADSGLFIYPDLAIAGDYDPDWFMYEEVYGRVNGEDDVLVSRIQGRKPYYEEYPITIDFTPLGAEGIHYELWSHTNLLQEAEGSDAVGQLLIVSGARVNPRVNPFWRFEDGSVGALIEFSRPQYDWYSFNVYAPFDEVAEDGFERGGKIVMRAKNPTNDVEYVSRAKVVLGGGLNAFAVVDERLGMFRRPHRAIGATLFRARDRRLTLAREASSLDPFLGTSIELSRSQVLDVELEALALGIPDASFHLFASGMITDQEDTLGQVELRNESGVLQLNALFDSLAEGEQVRVEVYRDGILAGETGVTNGPPSGILGVEPGGNLPRLLACGVSYDLQTLVPTLSFTLDREVNFLAQDGTPLEGTHFRLTPGNMALTAEAVDSFTIGVVEVPEFTIVDERTDAAVPELEIALVESGVTLSWPLRNQPIRLVRSGTVDGVYVAVADGVVLVGRRYQVTVPADGSSQFFKLER